VGDAATELEPFGGVTALVSSPESNIVTSKLNDKTQDSCHQILSVGEAK